MSIYVRAARHDDLDACVALLEQLFRLERDFSAQPLLQRQGLQQLLESDANQVLVADNGGEVVGMLSVQRLISTAEGTAVGLVEDVVVDAKWRGQGVGRLLMDALDDWARGEGLARLQLLADQHNHHALAFYQRLGWGRTQLTALRTLLR